MSPSPYSSIYIGPWLFFLLPQSLRNLSSPVPKSLQHLISELWASTSSEWSVFKPFQLQNIFTLIAACVSVISKTSILSPYS